MGENIATNRTHWSLHDTPSGKEYQVFALDMRQIISFNAMSRCQNVIILLPGALIFVSGDVLFFFFSERCCMFRGAIEQPYRDQ